MTDPHINHYPETEAGKKAFQMSLGKLYTLDHLIWLRVTAQQWTVNPSQGCQVLK